MRALRDFNIPKIVTDDLPVFMGLIGDLFPALDVPRKRDMDFEKQIKQAVLDLKLQAEEGFVLKVDNLLLNFETVLQVIVTRLYTIYTHILRCISGGAVARTVCRASLRLYSG